MFSLGDLALRAAATSLTAGAHLAGRDDLAEMFGALGRQVKGRLRLHEARAEAAAASADQQEDTPDDGDTGWPGDGGQDATDFVDMDPTAGSELAGSDLTDGIGGVLHSVGEWFAELW
jgi:hypothetical protein